MKAAFISVQRHGAVDGVFDAIRKERLYEMYEFYPETILPEDFEKVKDFLKDTELLFSTWGMYRFKEEEIHTYFPKLRAVFYAAGSVKGFAQPLLNCGIKIFSAVSMNAVPVAEYVFAQITLANKGLWGLLSRNTRAEKSSYSDKFPGNYGAKVGLIGMGNVARHLAEKLKSLNLKVYAHDPYLFDEAAKKYNVEKADLNKIFSECDVISNHLPDIPELFKTLDYKYFCKMKPYATFINTGRGREVVEEDLVRAMKEVPTRTAILDVTFPEPPLEDSILYTASNIIVTPHVAGSKGEEVKRMADFMIDESERFVKGEETFGEIDAETLARMA